MTNLELNKYVFACEICDEITVNSPTMGIELDRNLTSSIRLCGGCGAIDLDLMQLCRETTIGCGVN